MVCFQAGQQCWVESLTDQSWGLFYFCCSWTNYLLGSSIVWKCLPMTRKFGVKSLPNRIPPVFRKIWTSWFLGHKHGFSSSILRSARWCTLDIRSTQNIIWQTAGRQCNSALSRKKRTSVSTLWITWNQVSSALHHPAKQCLSCG